MQVYYIYKGSRKIDNFYLNSFPFKYVHYLDKKSNEVDLAVDDFNFFFRAKFNDMFPIRKNSCIFFPTELQAKRYIDNAIESINTDDRFNLECKIRLIDYVKTFKIGF